MKLFESPYVVLAVKSVTWKDLIDDCILDCCPWKHPYRVILIEEKNVTYLLLKINCTGKILKEEEMIDPTGDYYIQPMLKRNNLEL